MDWQLRLQDVCPVPLNRKYKYSILNTSPGRSLPRTAPSCSTTTSETPLLGSAATTLTMDATSHLRTVWSRVAKLLPPQNRAWSPEGSRSEHPQVRQVCIQVFSSELLSIVRLEDESKGSWRCWRARPNQGVRCVVDVDARPRCRGWVSMQWRAKFISWSTGRQEECSQVKIFFPHLDVLFFSLINFFSLFLRQVQMMGPQGSIWGLFLSFFCVHLCLIMCKHWCTQVMLCRSCLHRWIFPRRCRCRYSGLVDEAVPFSHT